METQIMEMGWARQTGGEPEIRELAAAQQLSANWFAAYTNSHHEKRVALHCAERRIESFLPLFATRHRWKNGCDMDLELPLFPNYVFVRIDPRERGRVLDTPGIVSLVGFGRTLAPLPDFEIEALRSALGQRKLEPHAYLVVGERVRIMAGPMTGIEGVLVREKSDLRLVLALDVIMQCVAVEVDADDLEPAPKSSRQAFPSPDLAGRPNRPARLCRSI